MDDYRWIILSKYKRTPGNICTHTQQHRDAKMVGKHGSGLGPIWNLLSVQLAPVDPLTVDSRLEQTTHPPTIHQGSLPDVVWNIFGKGKYLHVSKPSAISCPAALHSRCQDWRQNQDLSWCQAIFAGEHMIKLVHKWQCREAITKNGWSVGLFTSVTNSKPLFWVLSVFVSPYWVILGTYSLGKYAPDIGQ